MRIFSLFNFANNLDLDLHWLTYFDSNPWWAWSSSPRRFSKILFPSISGLFHSILFSVSSPIPPSVPLSQYGSSLLSPVRTQHSMDPSLWQSIGKEVSNPILINIIRGVISLLELFFLEYSSIVFLPNQSGDFGQDVTWLGGLSPTFDRWSQLANGCLLIIRREYNVVRNNNRSIRSTQYQMNLIW